MGVRKRRKWNGEAVVLLVTAKSLTAPAGMSESRETEPPGQETRERPGAFISCGGSEGDHVRMGAMCTGADFDHGRGEKDLDRAA